MRLHCLASNLVPRPEVDLGDLRKPILRLPAFMDAEWVSKNVFMSEPARQVFGIWAEEMEAETGAPLTSFDWPEGPTPAEFTELMRYPLLMRSVATRCSMADPRWMSSNTDVFLLAANDFMTMLQDRIIRSGEIMAPSKVVNAVLERGTKEEAGRAIEFLAAFSMLVPVPGMAEMRRDNPQAFVDVATFIDENEAYLGLIDNALKSQGKKLEKDARTRIVTYSLVVPSSTDDNPFLQPLDDDFGWSDQLPFDEWLPSDDGFARLVRAVSPAMAEESGFDWPAALDRTGSVAESARECLRHPMALASLATRAALLMPERFDSWRDVFRGPAFPSVRDIEAMKASLAEGTAEERQAAHDGLLLQCLVFPTEGALTLLRQHGHPTRPMGHGPVKAASRRLDSLLVPNFHPASSLPRNDKTGGEARDVSGGYSPRLN